jgi:hypothetical protein
MNRREALEQLEVVRSKSDLTDSELAGAIDALEDDAPARQEFDRRLMLDQAIATEMRQVEVPVGLRANLLAACDSQNQPAAKARPKSRRKLFAVVAVAALALLAGFFLLPGKPTVSFSQILSSAPRDSAEIEQLDQDFRLENMPVALERLLRNRPSVAWPEAQNESTSVVVAGRNWVLVVTPEDQIDDVPNLNDGATVGGVDSGFAYQAWGNEGFVYVLFVRGTKRDLDRVYNREFATAAA